MGYAWVTEDEQSYNIQATSKGSDKTAHMRRLISAFAGRTYHIVGNFKMRIIICMQSRVLFRMQANTMNHYQTAPMGTGRSGSILFAK